MDFFQEVQLDAPQAEAMARGLYAVAKVDGVHAREAALVAAFYSEVGGNSQGLAELERGEPITASELAATLHSPEERQLFIKTALLLAWADGVITPQEQQMIAEFAGALGIDATAVQKLDEGVKEYLLGHLSHVQNTDATVAVAQKLKV